MSLPTRFNPISFKLATAYAFLSFFILFSFAFFALMTIDNQAKKAFEYGYATLVEESDQAALIIFPAREFRLDIKTVTEKFAKINPTYGTTIQPAGDNFYFSVNDPIDLYIVMSRGQLPNTAHLGSAINERTFYIESFTLQNGVFYRVAAVDSSYIQWQKTRTDLTNILIVVAAGAVLVSLALALFISSQITKPLRKIAAAVSVTSASNIGKQITIRSDDEVGLVALAFNRMSSHLAQSVEAQKRFVADAAHELKTPLSSLTTATTRALQGEHSTEEYISALEIINQNLHNMKTIVNDLLYMAKLDEEASKEVENPIINLEVVASNIYDTFLPLCEEKEVVLQVRWRDIYVRADQEKMQRLLINLVGNAIKHSSPGDAVGLVFGATEHEAIIVVSDSGKGIPSEYLDKIFNRFYKIPSKQDYNEGTGLGLAICKAIVESMGGTINVQSKVGVGTTFSVSLPLALEYND